MGAFWECRTCFEQHRELRDAERCCDNRKAALEERAAIVAWLRKENGRCDCFAYDDNECACGGRDEYKTWPLQHTADRIEAGEHLK